MSLATIFYRCNLFNNSWRLYIPSLLMLRMHFFKSFLLSALHDLRQCDEFYWKERSQVQWWQKSDRNSKFFHLTTLQRRQHNVISRLQNDFGWWVEGDSAIQSLVRDFV